MINKNLFLAKSFVDQGIVSVSNFLIIIFSANVLIPQQHGLLSLIIASLIAIQSITIPLISWGSFLYLKQENNPIIYQKILAALSLIIAVIFSIKVGMCFCRNYCCVPHVCLQRPPPRTAK